MGGGWGERAGDGDKKEWMLIHNIHFQSPLEPPTPARQSEENGSKNFRPMADSDGQFFQTIKTIFSDPTKTTLFAPWRTSMPINSAVYTYQQCVPFFNAVHRVRVNITVQGVRYEYIQRR